MPAAASSRRNAAASSRRNAAVSAGFFGRLFGGGGGEDGAVSRAEVSDEEAAAAYHADIMPPFDSRLVADTFLAGRELACCYSATRDGFGATQFHSRCDFRGPCVVVGVTIAGLRFGGFNPEGFRSTDDYSDTLEAFLFYWPDPTSASGDSSSSSYTGSSMSGCTDDKSEDINEDSEKGAWGLPVVLKKVGGSGAAVFDYARGGPQFGPDGLLIGPPLTPVMGGFAGPDSSSGFGVLKSAYSRLGLSYAARPDGQTSLFGEERTADVAEVMVFCSPAIAAMYSSER